MEEITVKTNSRTELIDITAQVQVAVEKMGIQDGTVVVYVPHTTAAVTINENADPTVKSDVVKVLNQVIPWEADYRHLEGNSAAHIKSSLIGASELLLIENGRLVLGTWQGVFFCEFDGPRRRRAWVKVFSQA
ncbi:MAG: secondary thiamine-phosphate synthase enzyme YjbQ [Desulfobacterales bacterium]